MAFIAVITIAAVAIVAILIAAAGRGVRGADASLPAEGHGLSDSAAAAMGDVAGPMFGVDAHPTSPEALSQKIP